MGLINIDGNFTCSNTTFKEFYADLGGNTITEERGENIRDAFTETTNKSNTKSPESNRITCHDRAAPYSTEEKVGATACDDQRVASEERF